LIEIFRKTLDSHQENPSKKVIREVNKLIFAIDNKKKADYLLEKII